MGKKKDLQMENYVRDMISDQEALVHMNTKHLSYNDENIGGVLAITDKRVIYHNDTFLKGKVTVEYPYDKITTIEQNKDEVNLIGSGIKAEFEFYSRSDVDEVANALRKQLEKSKSAKTEQSAPSETDFISQLERLAELKKQGILTEEEFQSQKKRILEY